MYPAGFPLDDVQVRGGDARAVVYDGGVRARAGPRYSGQPGDFGGDADALGECFHERVADVLWTANVVLELGLT